MVKRIILHEFLFYIWKYFIELLYKNRMILAHDRYIDQWDKIEDSNTYCILINMVVSYDTWNRVKYTLKFFHAFIFAKHLLLAKYLL